MFDDLYKWFIGGVVGALLGVAGLGLFQSDGPEPLPKEEPPAILAESFCKDGWDNVSDFTSDAISLTCTRVIDGERWFVSVNPPMEEGGDFTFGKGWKDKDPSGFKLTPSEVPTWR